MRVWDFAEEIADKVLDDICTDGGGSWILRFCRYVWVH